LLDIERQSAIQLIRIHPQGRGATLFDEVFASRRETAPSTMSGLLSHTWFIKITILLYKRGIIMFFVGAIFAVVITALVFWVIKQGISVRWWEWLIGAIGIALLIFTVQNFLGSFVENEPKAAWMFWLVLGLPSLIILAIPTVLVIMRRKNA